MGVNGSGSLTDGLYIGLRFQWFDFDFTCFCSGPRFAYFIFNEAGARWDGQLEMSILDTEQLVT